MNLEQTKANHTEQVSESRGAHAAPEAFPGVRYFQVHFEHIEALIAELHSSLEQVRGDLAHMRSLARGGSECGETFRQVVLYPEEDACPQRDD